MVVNYIAPADGTGYACAAAGYVQLLRAGGVRVHFHALQAGPGLGLWYDCGTLGAPLDPSAVTVLHAVPESYGPLCHWLRAHGIHGPVVGMTVWETSRIPAHWAALLNQMRALIVPSAWNHRVFQECGVNVPIFQVPHVSQFRGVRPRDAAVEALRRRLPELHNKFIFYSIGAWSHRKGNDLLVHAFSQAFAGRNDVALILKSSARSLDPPGPRWRRGLRKLLRKRSLYERLLRGNFPGITLLTDELHEDEIRALHVIGDCYVSCARGEGWALGLYEAIFFRKIVLAPRQGGHREYLRDEGYAGLLDGRQIAVRTPGVDRSYRPDQKWYEIDVSEAGKKMCEVYSAAATFPPAVEALADAVEVTFSHEVILTAFLRALRVVQDGK